MRTVLQSAGYAVAIYRSAEALLAAEQTDHASCLLIDNGLPGLSGIELLETLRARGDTVPAIIVTALAGAARRAGGTSGCAGFPGKAGSRRGTAGERAPLPGLRARWGINESPSDPAHAPPSWPDLFRPSTSFAVGINERHGWPGQARP